MQYIRKKGSKVFHIKKTRPEHFVCGVEIKDTAEMFNKRPAQRVDRSICKSCDRMKDAKFV